MNESIQASLLREKMSKASAPRIDSPEILAEAAKNTVAVVEAQMGVRGSGAAAPAGSGATEATLPGIGSAGQPGADVRSRLKYSSPRIDGVGVTRPVVESDEAGADEQVRVGSGAGKKGWGISIGATSDGGYAIGGNVGTNSGRYGGSVTVGKTGMPGATDIPGTGISIRDGSFASPNVSVGGLFRGTRRERPGREFPDSLGVGSRVPSPYEGTEITYNGIHGVIVEVQGDQAAVALDSPVEGNHMIFIDLRTVAGEGAVEGSCIRCGTGINESQKFCGGCGNPLHEARSEQAAHDSMVRKLAQAGHVGKALVHAFTGMDRQGKFGKNQYALGHYIKASNAVHDHMKKGHSLEKAFASHFVPTRETARAAKLVGAKLKVERGDWVEHD